MPGLGIGFPFWGGGVLPSAFGNLVAWWDLGAEPYDKLYKDGAGEQLTNGDFEVGDSPPTGWSAINNATLTSETGTPYEGTYCGRCAYNGTANPAMKQTPLVVGATYYYHGVARVSAGYARIYDGNFSNISPDSDWVTHHHVSKPTITEFRLQLVASSGYAEFDDWRVAECPGRTTDQNKVNPGTHDLTQTGGAGIQPVYAPIWGEEGGLTAALADGVDDLANANTLAGALFSGTGEAWSYGGSIEPLDLTGSQTIWCPGNAASADKYLHLWCDGTTLKLTQVDDGGTPVTQTIKSGLSIARHDIVVTCNGTTMSAWVDGALEANGLAFAPGATTMDQFAMWARNRNAIDQYGHFGGRDQCFYSGDIGAANATGLSAWLQSRSPLS